MADTKRKTNGRNEVISYFAEKLDIKKIEAQKIVDTFTDFVVDKVVEGESVLLKGIGKVEAIRRAAKKGRDIKNNKFIDIPESFVPKFKAAEKFVEKVKANEKHLKTVIK